MNNETSYFSFQIIRFKQYFYVSLGNIFYCFVEAPLFVEALGNCPACPPLNLALIILFWHAVMQYETKTLISLLSMASLSAELHQLAHSFMSHNSMYFFKYCRNKTKTEENIDL